MAEKGCQLCLSPFFSTLPDWPACRNFYAFFSALLAGMSEYLESAIGIAQRAGSLLRYYFERHVRVELKGAFDLVTEADRASEKLIVGR